MMTIGQVYIRWRGRDDDDDDDNDGDGDDDDDDCWAGGYMRGRDRDDKWPRFQWTRKRKESFFMSSRIYCKVGIGIYGSADKIFNLQIVIDTKI